MLHYGWVVTPTSPNKVLHTNHGGVVRHHHATMKGKAKIRIVLAGLLLGGIAFTMFFVSSDAVAEDKFAQITDGMTEMQVREILGVPHRVRPDASDRTTFFYGGFHRLKWCSMEIFFGADGRVTGKFHDH